MAARSANGKHFGKSAMRRAGLRSGMGMHRAANYVIADRIVEALDTTTAPGKVRTLADMTPEERAKMLRLYAKPPTK